VIIIFFFNMKYITLFIHLRGHRLHIEFFDSASAQLQTEKEADILYGVDSVMKIALVSTAIKSPSSSKGPIRSHPARVLFGLGIITLSRT